MCLEHLALVLALTGEPERAAAVLGFTEARFAATGQVREWLEQAEYDRLLVLLHAALPDNRLAGLLAEGAGWTAESVDATALRASVAAAPRPAPPVMVS
jgi:hypothetical protein